MECAVARTKRKFPSPFITDIRLSVTVMTCVTPSIAAFSQSTSNASHMKVALRASLYAAALPAAVRWNQQLMTLPYSHSVSVVDLPRRKRIAERNRARGDRRVLAKHTVEPGYVADARK